MATVLLNYFGRRPGNNNQPMGSVRVGAGDQGQPFIGRGNSFSVFKPLLVRNPLFLYQKLLSHNVIMGLVPGKSDDFSPDFCLL